MSKLAALIRPALNVAEVATIKSDDWIDSVRLRSISNRTVRETRITDSAGFAMAEQVERTQQKLDKNPRLRTTYEAAIAKISEDIAAYRASKE